jgi:hypothetical protein
LPSRRDRPLIWSSYTPALPGILTLSLTGLGLSWLGSLSGLGYQLMTTAVFTPLLLASGAFFQHKTQPRRISTNQVEMLLFGVTMGVATAMAQYFSGKSWRRTKEFRGRFGGSLCFISLFSMKSNGWMVRDAVDRRTTRQE